MAHIYRRYTCNIEAPYIKCRTLSYDALLSAPVITYQGKSSSMTSSLTLTGVEIPFLRDNKYIFKLTVYFTNPTSDQYGYLEVVLKKGLVQLLNRVLGFKKQDVIFPSSFDSTVIKLFVDPTELSYFGWKVESI